MKEAVEIKSLVSAYMPAVDLSRIDAALAVVASGERAQADLEHAMAVVRIVCRLKLDVSCVCAALLHGVVGAQGAARLNGIVDDDTIRVAEGVAGLEKFQFSADKSRQAESFKKMLVAMARDIRVLMVKMADRLQELREVAGDPGDQARRMADESMLIYGPLAERMGISWMRTEIEDISFRILWPVDYANLKDAADRRLAERQDFIKGVIGRIDTLLLENGLTGFEVFGRQKNLYGIHKKMSVQGIPLEQVYDFVAFRVIVEKPADCWQVLGLIHNLWTPIPSRFKDFINVPKPNGYRSLHTSVIGPLGERMEVQIRTWQMHHDAESGIAAHWSYKESGRMEVRDQERFSFMKQLVEWAQEIQTAGAEGGSAGLLDEMRDNLFEDQVFVFTPQGDLRVLRQGATALDFAYDVHTQIGHSCTGVRVNGRLVPLATELASGDVVEVMTSRTAKPRRDWLNFVVTSRARTKIRSWLLDEERREALEIGRQILEKEFRKAGPQVLRFMKDFFVDEEKGRKTAEGFRIGSRDELIRAVGHGKIDAVDVVRAMIPAPADVSVADRVETVEATKADYLPKKLQNQTGIVVDGINGMLVHMARCCNPIPGDGIVGYVTRGRGVTIHNQSCQSVRDADPERLLPAQWSTGVGGTYNVPMRLSVEDVPGVLAGVTVEIGRHGANIAGVSSRRIDGNRHQVDVVLQVEDQKMLDAIMRSLRRVKGVSSVERVRQTASV